MYPLDTSSPLENPGTARRLCALPRVRHGALCPFSRQIDLFKSSAHDLCVIDLPRDLHRRVHEAAARKGCSARKLILAGIERDVEEAKSTRPSRRLSLDSPLTRPAGRRIRVTNEQAYELIELP